MIALKMERSTRMTVRGCGNGPKDDEGKGRDEQR